ncbi:hypothetical protein ILUMI_10484 [Ignelater luminosus]|uniref:DUF4371 domain-containing protein n=1 Tax=Ignelater luminosus TaxID=2038154 RepID=A0A8K0CY29_IGNLU|nr:hypothetical protein ILUMI_10484 [Ignelater luminosus]
MSLGYNDWKNFSSVLSFHEKSLEHISNYKIWYDLRKRLQTKNTRANELEKVYEMEKKHWFDILERIIEVIKFLGKQCLHYTLYKEDNGNFLKLLELLTKFDAPMSQHLQKSINKETSVNYLSKGIQNKLIQLIADRIKDSIINMTKNAKYYSIILDCILDISKTEQMTIIIRFVNADNSNIEEHFLGFVDISYSTGASLVDCILQKLDEFGLNISDLRGQGYDNGANMEGKKSGVQRRILNLNLKAFYVPCAAHTLNLVVNDAARVNKETIGFFENRDDEGFERLMKEAAGDMLMISNWSQLLNQFFFYEAEDEPLTDPKQNFKINCFLTIHDAALMSLEEYDLLKNTIENFDFLCKFSKLNALSQEELKNTATT